VEGHLISRSTVLTIVPFLLCGCSGSILPSHVHDPARAARTSKLASVIDAYGESAPSIYGTMLQSSQSIAIEQDKLLAELGNRREAALAQALPFRLMSTLVDNTNAAKIDLAKVETLLRTEVEKYLADRKIANEQFASAGAAIKKANEAVKIAKDNLTNWNASIAILEAGVAEVPSLLVRADKSTAEGKDGTEEGLKTFAQQVAGVGQKEVEFVDANGTTVKQKIQDILKDRVHAAVKGGSVKFPDAPGATLTILTLGLDLARLEKAKAEARLLQLSRRLELFERTQAELVLAQTLLDEVNFAPGDDERATAFQRVVGRNVISARGSQQAAARAVNGETDEQRQARVAAALNDADTDMLAVANHLLNLRKLTVADSVIVRAGLSLERNIKRLDHDESILDARANDQVWRTVIRAGVVTLDQYEQGGLKPEDAANIIRIAQTVALGAIAVRVD